MGASFKLLVFLIGLIGYSGIFVLRFETLIPHGCPDFSCLFAAGLLVGGGMILLGLLLLIVALPWLGLMSSEAQRGAYACLVTGIIILVLAFLTGFVRSLLFEP